MRIFFAIPLPEPALDAVAEALAPIRNGALPSGSRAIGWTRRNHLHLTLRFLGEVEEARIEAVGDAVAPWVRRLPPPRVRLVGGGVFPDARHPKVLWIGAEAALGPVVSAMEGALSRLGFAPEGRAFIPHLTVGRVRDGRVDRVLDALRDLGEVTTFSPESVVLYESRPAPEGVRYVALRTFRVE
ncbi:MAG: RNA 2',3'-cyclic phosphodiesterase [Pseudomonadota bacterium]|nr:RNA 2',3'-cyclic phosphodiesterase [Pseudomonadota bacterium]